MTFQYRARRVLADDLVNDDYRSIVMRKFTVSAVEFLVMEQLSMDKEGNTSFVRWVTVNDQNSSPRVLVDVSSVGGLSRKVKFLDGDEDQFTPDWVLELVRVADGMFT